MKFLYHLVLALLLLGSLAAGTVAAVWKWAPEQIELLDRGIKWRYLQEPKDELVRLTELAADEPEAALPGIRALSEALRHFKSKDHRMPTARMADRLLVGTLLSLGRTEEGLEVARQVAKIDPFDHSTRHWVAAQFLTADEPFYQEGIDQLAALFDQFPEDSPLARKLRAALAKRGDYRAALEVVLRHLQAIPDASETYDRFEFPWHIAAAPTKEDLGQAQTQAMVLVDSQERLICKATIPADARVVRISPPSRLRATFGEPIYSARIGKKSSSFGPLVDLPHETSHARLDQRGLDIHPAAKPTITFKLPDLPENESGGTNGELQLLIVVPKQRFPSWMEASLVSELAAPRVAEIQAEAEYSTKARFFAERVWLTRAYGMAAIGPFFHITGGATTRIPAKVRIDHAQASHSRGELDAVTFEGSISLADDTEELEIVVPTVVGMMIQLEQIDWVSADGKRIAADDISAADPAQLAAVEGAGPLTWRVLHGMTKPTLRVARPRDAGLTCELKGGLR